MSTVSWTVNECTKFIALRWLLNNFLFPKKTQLVKKILRLLWSSKKHHRIHKTPSSWIWSSHGGGYTEFYFLWQDTSCHVYSKPTFRKNISSSPSSRMTNKLSKKPAWSKQTNSPTLKMEGTYSYEILIDFQRTVRRYIPKDKILYSSLSFVSCIAFCDILRWGILNSTPILQPGHPRSAVRDVFITIFPAAFHTWRLSLYPKSWKRITPGWQGTH